MKPRMISRPEAGLNLFEVSVVVVVILLLAVVLMSMDASHQEKSKARRFACVNNLKQIGLSYRVWSGDQTDDYPMGKSVTNGGSMELVATGNVVYTFLVMSNELATPKILFCPSDSVKLCATTLGRLADSNISYFINADVTNGDQVQAILSGDGNFELGGKPVSPGLLSLGTNDPVAWTASRHFKTGNLLLGDGSVHTLTSNGLHNSFVNAGTATNHLAIP